MKMAGLVHKAIPLIATILKLTKMPSVISPPEIARNLANHIGIFTKVRRNFYWIWFIGAAAWFYDAASSLHHHSISWGVLEAIVSGTFLAVGMYFRKQGS